MRKRGRIRKRKIDYSHLFSLIIFVAIMIMAVHRILFHIDISHNYVVPDDVEVEQSYYDYTDLINPPFEDDRYYSIPFIDVSSHQGDIDFKAVKAYGIENVILRVGIRGYEKGEIYLDRRFEEYYHQAKSAGMKIGVYFFSQAVNTDEAIEEAIFVLKNIIYKDIDLPVVYDLEYIDYAEARANGLDDEQNTANAIAFLEKIREHGYTPMLYGSMSFLEDEYLLSKILNYKIWMAQYHEYPQFDYRLDCWQYTDQGEIPGIDEHVDLNYMFIEK